MLCCAFVAQTWLVYADSEGDDYLLSSVALEGQAVWRKNNCQSCHQLYGFGGFLGPDLTNSIDNLSPERLSAILTEGLGQMPAFELDPDDQHRIGVFLRELDQTGISQPKLGDVVTPTELLSQVLALEEGSAPGLLRGAELVQSQGCIGCHLPNEQSLHRAMDLTAMTTTLSRERVQTVLLDGIEGTAMPRLSMSAEDSQAVWDCLVWMNEHGEELRARFRGMATSEDFDLLQLPWFEYR